MYELRKVKPRVEAGSLQLYADDTFYGIDVFIYIIAGHNDLPFSFFTQRFNDLKGGGFTGAIGTQQPENFPFIHLKTYTFDSLETTIVFGKVFH